VTQVAYWTNIPAPYVVERFNALARRRNLRFEAWFSARQEPDRSWLVDERTWEFDYKYLPRSVVLGRRLAFPTPLFRRHLPELVIGLHAEAAVVATYPLFRLRGVRTAFWVTPTYDSWVDRRGWKEALKRAIFRRVDGVLTTGSDGRSFALRYGADPEAIYTLPHFVDFEYFARQGGVNRSARAHIRGKLGVSGLTYLYVGRLWRGKGVDDLLTAFAGLQREATQKVSLLLVGDGVDEDRFRERCRREHLANVVFAGFRQRDELPRMYAAADVFVFPTLGDPYGHVVEEAMSSALPVITTAAAGEIRDRIVDGESGFIVPPARPDALLSRMRLLAADDGLRDDMGRAAFERARGQTGEAWAEAFEAAVDALLRLSP
jgi:glycosyltransferase involved in cell wall biosynthesis